MAVSDDGLTVVGKWQDRNGELARLLDRDNGAARWDLNGVGQVFEMQDAGPGKFTAISRDGLVATGRMDAYAPAAAYSGGHFTIPVELAPDGKSEPERSRIAAMSSDGSVMAGWTSSLVRRNWKIAPSAWIDGTLHELPRPRHIFTTAGWAQGVSPNGRHIVGVMRGAQRTPFSVMWTRGNDDGQWAVRVLEDADGVSLPGAFAVSADGLAALGRSPKALWRWTPSGIEKLFEAPEGVWRVDVHSYCAGLNIVVGELRGDSDKPTGFIWTQSTGMRLFSDLVDDLDFDLGCSYPMPRWISGDGSLIVGEGIAQDGRIVGWMIRLEAGCLQATMLAAGLGGGDFIDLLSLISQGDARLDVTGALDRGDPAYGRPDGRTDAMELMMLLDWHSQGCL